jgi:hypothetical protein
MYSKLYENLIQIHVKLLLMFLEFLVGIQRARNWRETLGLCYKLRF